MNTALSAKLQRRVVAVHDGGDVLAHPLVNEGALGDEAKPNAIIQYCKSCAHERDRSGVDIRNGLAISDGDINDPVLGFDSLSRLFEVACSKR